MTSLEITHSLTVMEIDTLVSRMKPIIPKICNYLLDHRAVLIKPLLSYDSSAVALSFVPADTEGNQSDTMEKDITSNGYTYHHLRRDLFDLATGDYTKPSVKIESRYVVPSAHVTSELFFGISKCCPIKLISL